jgi:hypothetical protein
MQYEATTAELAEILDVTKKTVCEWQKSGIAVKLRHGVYDLKRTLINWRDYQRCIFEGADDPLALWEIRQQVAWSEAHPLDVDVKNLRPLPELEPFELELDAAGRIVRVVGEAE